MECMFSMEQWNEIGYQDLKTHKCEETKQQTLK